MSLTYPGGNYRADTAFDPIYSNVEIIYILFWTALIALQSQPYDADVDGGAGVGVVLHFINEGEEEWDNQVNEGHHNRQNQRGCFRI